MNGCLNLINKSVEEIKVNKMIISKTKTLPFVNDSTVMVILLKIEQTIFKYFKTFYKNLDLSKKHPISKLSFEFCNFLLDEHSKQRPRNYSSSDMSSSTRFEYDRKTRWLLMMAFCFMTTNLLFNSSWRLFMELVENLKSKFGHIISSKNKLT